MNGKVIKFKRSEESKKRIIEQFCKELEDLDIDEMIKRCNSIGKPVEIIIHKQDLQTEPDNGGNDEKD